MMILFTHGKKILGVKESKHNFTSRDDALFPNSTDHYFPPKATGIYLKGYKEPRYYRSKKEEEKEGGRVGGDNVRKRRSL